MGAGTVRAGLGLVMLAGVPLDKEFGFFSYMQQENTGRV